jgi:hypothetical protein
MSSGGVPVVKLGQLDTTGRKAAPMASSPDINNTSGDRTRRSPTWVPANLALAQICPERIAKLLVNPGRV